MKVLKGVYEEGVIERYTGYTDKMMHRHVKSCLDSMNKTTLVKEGRGIKAILVPKRMYIENPGVAKLNEISIKHYKKLMETPKKIEFRDYQNKIIVQGSKTLLLYNFLYLAMEVRTGKTLTSLGTAQLLKCKNVLFITKKKAISSIEDDFSLLRPDFNLTVINYESLHKIEDIKSFDMLICDESHSMGAFPKPSKRAKQVRDMMQHNPFVILLSGTPTPESYSQMYHQVWGIKNNPFKEFTSFYKFSKKYVNVTQRKINGMMINDYKDGSLDILSEMNKYTISYTQKQAGFKIETREHTLEVTMSDLTYKLAAKLKKDLVVEGKEEVILADTPVKLMMKLHQMYSGTVKFESGKSTILDLTKAEYIYDNFEYAKIGIFYKFKEELNALKQVYGDKLCTELDEFNTTDKTIALQIVSGREGISLRKAEALVYYNIDFSATSYWQSRDRMTTKERLESDVYWVFAKGGIEKDIYNAVTKKKDYTLNHFNRDHKL